jgi:uncharacterized protein DUF4145
MFVPDNSNVFQINNIVNDANPPAMSIRCPHCRELGSFDVIRAKSILFSKIGSDGPNRHPQNYLASIRICPNIQCKGLVFVIEVNGVAIEIEPPQLLDFNVENLPPRCQQTLKEAIACHGAGAYRAAAMMVRRLLEEICEDNAATGDNLHDRISALKSLVVLPLPLFEAMGELKALGNDAAHVEAKAYDNIGREEAEDSIELAKEILKALYQLKGLVGRLQARKISDAAKA